LIPPARKQELLSSHSLFQLQEVFANMKTSVKQYIWPNKFIESIKGFDNEPINVRVQQDANEFFNLVCDKLETDLKDTSNKRNFA
jgi:ubiquitin carboxyl-terminal hydrolase 34